MSVEAELKLALPHAHIALARRVFDELASTAGRPVPLANVYYDTPGLDLQRSRSALRLRRAGERWLQTFKSGGGANAGLHRRHEWEMQVSGEALDMEGLLAAIARDLEPGSDTVRERDADTERSSLRDALESLRKAAPNIGPLFRTDFLRTLWDLEDGDNRIEAALDEGEVSIGDGAQRQSMPILEIELELKHGDEAALHRIATILGERIPGLRHDDVSKAERGYRLHAQGRGA